MQQVTLYTLAQVATAIPQPAAELPLQQQKFQHYNITTSTWQQEAAMQQLTLLWLDNEKEEYMECLHHPFFKKIAAQLKKQE